MTVIIFENLILNNVMYIIDFKVNLISVGKVVFDNNLNINFNKSDFKLQERISGRVIGERKF